MPITHEGLPAIASKGPFIATQLNSTRRRIVDTFTAWTTVTAQFWTSWPSWLSCIADRRRRQL